MVISVADSPRIVSVARFPIDSKLGDSLPPSMISPVGVTDSLDFDGSTEYVRNNTSQTISIGTDWTINVWMKNDNNNSSNQYLLHLLGTGNNDRIYWEIFSGSDSDSVIVATYDSSGANPHFYAVQNTFTDTSSWHMFTNTHISASCRFWKDASNTGSDNSPTSTMSNSNRTIRLGVGFSGKIHSMAIWSAELNDTNLIAVYNGGDGTNFDLREDSGNYNQSANLQHWWVFGADDSSDNAMGTDYGNGVNPINIMEDAGNITTADLVADSPT